MGHSAQSAGGRLWFDINMYTPLTQQTGSGHTVLPRHSVGTHHGNDPTHNLLGHICHSHLSSLCHCELICGLKMCEASVCELISQVVPLKEVCRLMHINATHLIKRRGEKCWPGMIHQTIPHNA